MASHQEQGPVTRIEAEESTSLGFRERLLERALNVPSLGTLVAVGVAAGMMMFQSDKIRTDNFLIDDPDED